VEEQTATVQTFETHGHPLNVAFLSVISLLSDKTVVVYNLIAGFGFQRSDCNQPRSKKWNELFTTNAVQFSLNEI